jgi:hypothetical protein
MAIWLYTLSGAQAHPFGAGAREVQSLRYEKNQFWVFNWELDEKSNFNSKFNIDGLAKSQNLDGFEKCSRASRRSRWFVRGRANPEEWGVVVLRRSDLPGQIGFAVSQTRI